MTTAIYAASLDPITNGHLWLIEEAAQDYDHLIVAVGINRDKRYYLPIEDRAALATQAVSHLPNVSVTTMADVYMVDLAEQLQATRIVRGLRTTTDVEYEFRLEAFNLSRAPQIKTRYFHCPRDLEHISSSFVKALVGPLGWHHEVRKLVPPPVYQSLLRQRFEQLATTLLASQPWAKRLLAQGLVGEVAHAYGQGRAYHNLTHITSLLEEYLEQTSNHSAVLAFAIICHDLIYTPGSKTNELDSADWATGLMIHAGAPTDQVHRCNQLIMATADHQPHTPDEQLMVDLDLAVLGQRYYQSYLSAIRQEYAQVDDQAWRSGRTAFLETFLNRPNIYHTGRFNLLYEAAARRNLQAELDSLL